MSSGGVNTACTTQSTTQTEPLVSRRTALKLSGLLGVALLGGFGTGTASALSSGWTVVAIPDTQKYAESSSRISTARAQTAWIANNLSRERIAFVTHEGDWVEHGGNRTEWKRMDGVWDTIEGKVPYAAGNGNHDFATVGDRRSSTAYYRQYFGKSRYQNYSWYGGSSPDDMSHYQRFSAGGYKFLHMNLEWEVPDEAMSWAKSVLKANPKTPTIITTHAYVWDMPGREGRATVIQEKNDDGHSGNQIWRELIRQNPQVFMVLNGHFHKGSGTSIGEWGQLSTNAAGKSVYEMLANFQTYQNGGDGWMRLIQFLPGGGSGGKDRIRVRTYSPSRNQYQTDGRSEFSFDLSFADRFGTSTSSGSDPAPEPEPQPPTSGNRTATFQNGTGGYSGTLDTSLREADPNTSRGSASTLTVDTNDPHGTGKEVQVLMRFNNIIGSGSTQVPRGATVKSATLTLRTVDRGSGASLHRMRRNWSESDTWNSLSSGVKTDGSEAVAAADANTGQTQTGTTTINVTKSVQAWANGDANYGWVFVPRGSNGWDFMSAEGSTRPKLTVTFE